MQDVRTAILAWLKQSGVEAPERTAELLAATVGAGESEVTDRSALLVQSGLRVLESLSDVEQLARFQRAVGSGGRRA